MRRDVFQAIADPTRREIITMLTHTPMNLNAIAGNFEISRPAISKHIKILTECGLITIRQEGRERYCKAELDRLNEITRWIDQNRRLWAKKLDNLEHFLNESSQSKNSSKPNKKARK